MHAGKLVFAQLMGHLPPMAFERCVARYGGNLKVKRFNCMDQFLCMAFAQLTYRESLRDIEACLRAQSEKLYHMGIRGQVSRNTLAHANATRDWRIYADFAQRLIAIARGLYVSEPFGVDLTNTAYALDSTTIDLSLSLFPWAPFRSTKAAVKMHTLLDLRGNIPSFIHISDGKLHDVNILDQLIPEAGAFYVMDRGYIDFERLYRLHQAGSFFVTRAKKNMDAQRRYSHPVDRPTGVIFDQTLVLQGTLRHQGLSRELPRRALQGSRNRQAFLVHHQQHCPATPEHLRPLQGPLAGEVILSMDQAASTHQVLLWNLRKRRQIANLDRRVGLCPRRHRPQTSRSVAQPLRNATDFELDPVRKNRIEYGVFSIQQPARNRLVSQSIDSIRITLGQA